MPDIIDIEPNGDRLIFSSVDGEWNIAEAQYLAHFDDGTTAIHGEGLARVYRRNPYYGEPDEPEWNEVQPSHRSVPSVVRKAYEVCGL